MPPPLAPMRGQAAAPNPPLAARTVQAAHGLDQWLLGHPDNTQEAIDGAAVHDFAVNAAAAAAAEPVDVDDDDDADAGPPYEYTWNGTSEMTVRERATGTDVGSMDLDECEDGRVWLDHIHVDAGHRRRGIAIRMITLAVQVHGASLRLPGLGVAGTHQYYWHDGQGLALGQACVARGIITAAQHTDPDVPLEDDDGDNSD